MPTVFGRLLRRRTKAVPVVPVTGVPRLTRDDAGALRCTACALCTAACPAHCLRVVAGPAGDGVLRTAARFTLDLARCIQCGLCETACPVDAIRLDAPLPAGAATVERFHLDLGQPPA